MLDFFNGSALQLSLIVVGVGLLGLALIYGVSRSGRIRGQERRTLDRNTERAQANEDPQK